MGVCLEHRHTSVNTVCAKMQNVVRLHNVVRVANHFALIGSFPNFIAALPRKEN